MSRRLREEGGGARYDAVDATLEAEEKEEKDVRAVHSKRQRLDGDTAATLPLPPRRRPPLSALLTVPAAVISHRLLPFFHLQRLMDTRRLCRSLHRLCEAEAVRSLNASFQCETPRICPATGRAEPRIYSRFDAALVSRHVWLYAVRPEGEEPQLLDTPLSSLRPETRPGTELSMYGRGDDFRETLRLLLLVRGSAAALMSWRWQAHGGPDWTAAVQVGYHAALDHRLKRQLALALQQAGLGWREQRWKAASTSYDFRPGDVRLVWQERWTAQQLPPRHSGAAKKELNTRLHAVMLGLGMRCPARGCGWGGCAAAAAEN